MKSVELSQWEILAIETALLKLRKSGFVHVNSLNALIEKFTKI